MNFAGYTIPIYYADGHTGLADQWTVDLIRNGLDFGARLQPWNEEDMAPRKPKAKPESSVGDLIAALKFINLADREDQGGFDGHAVFINGYIVNFDGVLSLGAVVKETLELCPHIDKFIAALSKAEGQVVISQTPAGRVSVKGTGFSAFIECLTPEDMPYYGPDPWAGEINDDVINAIVTAALVAREADSRLAFASVLLKANVAQGTNGHTIIEAWHGFGFPGQYVIPKKSIQALVRAKGTKSVAGLGMSDTSLTFYFDDKSFFKTQLYRDGEWPANIDVLMTGMPTTSFAPIPEKMAVAVDAVSPHGTGFIFFAENALKSSQHDQDGATYDLEGIPPAALSYSAPYLSIALKISTHFDITSERDKGWFYGNNARMLIAGAT